MCVCCVLCRRYQRRWFELTGHYLKYFPVNSPARDFSSIRGALDLRQLKSISYQGNSKTELVIVVVASSGDLDDDRRLEIRAISSDIAAQWKAALEEFVNNTAAS